MLPNGIYLKKPEFPFNDVYMSNITTINDLQKSKVQAPLRRKIAKYSLEISYAK